MGYRIIILRISDFEMDIPPFYSSKAQFASGPLWKFLKEYEKKQGERPYGTIRVSYGAKKSKLHNEFDFEGFHDMETKLAPCIERSLLDELAES